MSHAWCQYCGASEGRCVVVGGGRFLTECRSCGRVVEERRNEVEEMFVERALDAPLCIVTPDFSENENYRAPPIEDDPFESIGFITAFSTWSLEQMPLCTTTSMSFSGQLAELERVLSDSLYSGGGLVPANLAGASMSMVDTLRAYFQIVEVSSILGLERDSCDHAIQLFRDCLSTTYVRNRNIEALATAALVQAIREAQEPRTLQEISAAANVPQKEIGKYMKVLSDALKLSQPINSNSISVHMPRFCNLLQLSKTTQDLATHIGEVVINKSFCTRRNPISISAAAIYLSCQLEDKRKTQTEICKATGLTEVTLRKVYKELLENLDDLLPPDYTPAVPLEKAFPVTAAALGRVNVARAAAGAVPMSDPSLPTTRNSAVSNNSAGLVADTSSGVGGSGASSPAQANLVRSPAPGLSATDRATAVPYRGSTPPSSEGRTGAHLFAVPSPALAGASGGEAVDRISMRHDGPKEVERGRDRNDRERDSEQRERLDTDYAGHKKVNMMPNPSPPMSGFRPSFFPFAHVDPRVFQEMNAGMWPVHLYGGIPAMRAEEAVTSTRGNDRGREDGVANAALSNSKISSQYVGFVPDGFRMPEGLNSSMQLKMLQLTQRTPDSVERQAATLERERELERQREHESKSSEPASRSVSVSAMNSVAPQPFNTASAAVAAAASTGRPLYPSFPQGMWPYLSAGNAASYGIYPHMVQTQAGGVPQGIAQGGENHSLVNSENNMEGVPHGLLSSTGVEAMPRIGGPMGLAGQPGGLGGQLGHVTLQWPGPPGCHHFVIPANMNVGPGSAIGISNDGLNGMKREGSSGEGNVQMPLSGPGNDMFPMLSMGGNHAPQGSAGHPSVSGSQRADNGELTTNSVSKSSPPSFDRQKPHGQH